MVKTGVSAGNPLQFDDSLMIVMPDGGDAVGNPSSVTVLDLNLRTTFSLTHTIYAR